MKTIKEILEKHREQDSCAPHWITMKHAELAVKEYSDLTNAKLVEENERLMNYIKEANSKILELKVENERVNSLLDDYERSGCELENYNNKIIKQLQSELYAAKERLNEMDIKSVCVHEYITDANWKSLTCWKCNNKIEPKQAVL